MKRATIFSAFALLCIVLLTGGCTKKSGKEVAFEQNDFSNKAFVQIYNATVNSTGTTNVFVYAMQVTAASVTFGTAFPSSAAGFVVDAGLRSFSIRSSSATPVQATINFVENFDMNKYYTIFMYDTTTAAKQKTVVTNIVIPSDSTARVRFANFIYNNGVPPPVDVFSKVRNANIFTNVATTEVTEFIPYASSLSDTLLVRETGTNVLLATLNGFNPTRKRSYTVVYRGSYKGTRAVSAFANN